MKQKGNWELYHSNYDGVHMQLLFIDESGFIPKKENATDEHILTLGGIIIHEETWFKVSDDVKRIKKEFNVHGEIKWRYFYSKYTKSDNSLLHLDEGDKNLLRDSIYNTIASYNSIKLIGSVCLIQKAYNEYWTSNEDDLYWHTYKKLAERFQYFLQDMSRDVGSRMNGIIICDPRGSNSDDKLRLLHYKMTNENMVSAAVYKNLIEGLFFSPSHLSIGIQLADLVAGAVHQRAKGKTKYFEKIENNFRKSKQGTLNGYGIVTWPK